MPAAFTKFYPHPKDSLVTKYLNLDPIQRDLVYQIFSTGFEDVLKEKRNGYYINEYTENKIPPATHGLYRVKIMKKIMKKEKTYHDMNNLLLLVKSGYTKFGYVPDAGYYHFHADSLSQLLSKRVRNIKKSYLTVYNNPVHYKWFDLTNIKDDVKLILLIVSANLFIPLLLFSFFRMIKHKTWLYILEPFITICLVDVILFTFLKEAKGREFIKRNLVRIILRKKSLYITK
jgi:hypothetical protein